MQYEEVFMEPNPRLYLLTIILMGLFFRITFAADLVRILPVTDKILQVTFDEGHIDYFGIYGNRYDDNVCYYQALNTGRSVESDRYTITSTDDPNYTGHQNPVALGRKAKGVDFNNIYQNNEPKAVKHHWIYLELPFEMQTGHTYTVTMNRLAGNVNEYKLTFDENHQRSPAIHVNQVGYVPEAPKYAYISHFMGDFDHAPHDKGALNLEKYDGADFYLFDVANGRRVYSGKVAFHKSKSNPDFKTDKGFEHANMTLADVYECDFSEFAAPGEYKIVVENMGCSYPFEIGADVYREPYYWTSRAMFTQRQGIVQEIEPGVLYPRDHHTDDGLVIKYFPDETGEKKFDPDGGVGEIKGVWGWYHDAGDWDGYAHHYRVPMILLALYDIKPENFGDGDVHLKYKEADDAPWILEHQNGIPDVLDEASWLIRFFKRARRALQDQGYSDGGVPGYVGVDAGSDDDGVLPSWEDTRVMALKGGNIVPMTYRYAACAAWLAVCLDKAGGATPHPRSAGWIQEARDAYAWAKDQNKDGDGDVNRAKMEAAAALYRYTAETAYQDDFRTCKNRDNNWGSAALWFNLHPWHHAAAIFALIPDDHPGLDAGLKQACIDAITNRADRETVDTAAGRGFRYGADRNILFILGTFSTPKIFLAAYAHELTGRQKYLDVCYSTCDYCLGGNQMNMVKISGVGENPERQPFHIDSWCLYDYNSMVYTNPILPGYVPYEMHRNGDWMSGNLGDIGNGWSWVGDEDFSRSTAYPAIGDFPDAEARFWNRNSIAGSEWTVHQTLCQAIFAYGYLCGDFTGPYTANQRPTVALNLQDGLEIPQDKTVTLCVTASPDVRRVEYYYDWHFIGESTDRDNDFAFKWELEKYKTSRKETLITAKAFDDRGLVSAPGDAGEKCVQITRATAVEGEDGQSLKYNLEMNYPNPFNACTKISYQLPKTTSVEITVYDIAGKKVKTLVDAVHTPGTHTVLWNASAVSSGVYFYQLVAAEYLERRKCVLVR